MAKFIKVKSTDGESIDNIRINIENIGTYKENNAYPVGSQITLNICNDNGSNIVIHSKEAPDEIDKKIKNAEEC